MNKYFTLFFCLTAGFSQYNFLIANHHRSVTQEEIISHGLEHNPGLQAARSLIQQAEANQLDRDRLPNPVLSLSYNSDQTFNDEGQRSYQLAIEQSFPITRRLSTLRKITQSEIKLAQVELAYAESRLTEEIKLTLADLHFTKNNIELLQKKRNRYEEHLALLESATSIGEQSIITTTQTSLQLFEIEQQLFELSLQQEQIRSQLQGTIGWTETPLPTIQISNAPSTQEVSPTIDWSLHPLVQLQQQLNTLTSHTVDFAQAGRWGDLSISVFYENSQAIDEPVGLEDEQFLGIGFSFPLPLHQQNRSEIKRARLAHTQQVRATQSTIQGLQLRATQLSSQINQLQKRHSSYQKKLHDVITPYRESAELSYQKGQISPSEWMAIQDQHVELTQSALALHHQLTRSLISWENMVSHANLSQ